jgi:hypothetical protein
MLSGSPVYSVFRWISWNLLLLVPLLVLVTPLYNREEPRLLGFPFFHKEYVHRDATAAQEASRQDRLAGGEVRCGGTDRVD